MPRCTDVDNGSFTTPDFTSAGLKYHVRMNPFILKALQSLHNWENIEIKKCCQVRHDVYQSYFHRLGKDYQGVLENNYNYHVYSRVIKEELAIPHKNNGL